MKNKTLQTILIFFAFGVVSGFLSLMLMSLVPLRFANNETVFSISLLAIVEEIVKFSFLYFIFSTHSLDRFHNSLKLFVFPVFLGLGFSFLELSMIFYGQSFIPFKAFFPTIVHITSALLLANAVNLLFTRNSKVRAFLFLLLAVFIHICYNITVVKIV